MAKGKGKKGKGKKKKKVVEIDPNALTEVDKAFYELTITDLNRKLARLRSLTQELELKNEALEQEKATLDEDRNDVIIYLKRILQEKMDEIAELEERITALQETRQEETEKFEEKIREMENEYTMMHEQLTSENKLLEGKLNSLEEFRAQRDELMKKFELQENAMEEQEKRHKRELYEIERKFIISKDQLKKDMENRLMKLSTEFHDATELRIAATTHRVIRENIAINNELDTLLGSQQRLYNENLAAKKRDVNLKLQAELHEAEKKKALSKVKVQLKLIEKLTDEHKFMKAQLTKYKRYEDEVFKSRNVVQDLTNTVENLKLKQRILEQNLHHVRCDRTSVDTAYLYAKEENERLSEVLMEAVSCIKEALTVRTADDQSLKVSKRENLLNSLFVLLSKAKDKKIRKPSLDTIDIVETTYTKGDLGFVPRPVELRSFVPIKRNMESQTGDSFEEYFNYGTVTAPKLLYTESCSSFYVQHEEEAQQEAEEESIKSVLFYDETELEGEESTNSKDFELLLMDDIEEGLDTPTSTPVPPDTIKPQPKPQSAAVLASQTTVQKGMDKSQTVIPVQSGMVKSQTVMPVQSGMVKSQTGMPVQSGMVKSQTVMPVQSGMVKSQTVVPVQSGMVKSQTVTSVQSGMIKSQTVTPVQSGMVMSQTEVATQAQSGMVKSQTEVKASASKISRRSSQSMTKKDVSSRSVTSTSQKVPEISKSTENN